MPFSNTTSSVVCKPPDPEGKCTKRVRFEEKPTYHEPITKEEEDKALWYTQEELAKNFQEDARETRRYLLQTAAMKLYQSREPTNDANTNLHKKSDDLDCTRGMEMLSSDDKTRLARCALFRVLVIKQYNILNLKGLLGDDEATKRIHAFASRNSQWAKDRATALAAKDAVDARKVYQEAAKENLAKGEDILVAPAPSAKKKRFFGRGLRRNANRALSA